MTWSRVTVAPKIVYVGSGWLASPGADAIVWFPNSISATAGRATDTPIVDTILISGDDRRRCRKSARYRKAPSAGPPRKTETASAGSWSQPCWVFRK
jgi:hypothetical protein